LKTGVGYPVDFIAYPEGKYNDMIKEETKNAGYAAAFTVETGRDYPSG
jgi:hypothetical protein